MNNSTYWANRFKALEDRQYRKSAAFVEGLKAKFDYADDELETNLYKWYSKLMKNTDAPSLNDAKKLLKEDELKEFHWTLEQYEKYAKEHGLDPEWIKKLENASARKHISRYEQIQLQMRQIEEKLYAEYNNECYGYLGELVEDSYYHTAYEIEKGTGIGIDLHKLDRDTVEKYLTHPWCQDGKVFSDRIWQRKDELVRTLDQELTRQLITGADPQKAIDAISDKFDVSKRQAGTLVMTESAAIASEASKDSMKNLGVEEYEILATLDSHTSEICQEMDGQHFRMSEYNPGLTAPPFHPNCRSTTIPYFDDEFTTGETRAARDKNDKDYERVPADMKYGEWKKQYIDGIKAENSNKSVEEYMTDVTKDWENSPNAGKGEIKEADSAEYKGVIYHIDGRNVKQNNSDREKEVAGMLLEKYGGTIEYVPEVNGKYHGVRTPDYLWNGARWDLKEIKKAKRDDAVRDLVHKSKDQTENIIIDVTHSQFLSYEQIEAQVKGLKKYDNCSHIDKIMIIKEKEVLKIYENK